MYKIEKTYWTEQDFEDMGWHDSRIHGISFVSSPDPDVFQTELWLDIDYVFQRVDPIPPSNLFTFWISPCTLVFHDFVEFHADLKSGQSVGGFFEIQELKVAKGGSTRIDSVLQVILETNFGEIAFQTSRYEQFVRASPVHSKKLNLDLKERGGVSFGRVYNQ